MIVSIELFYAGKEYDESVAGRLLEYIDSMSVEGLVDGIEQSKEKCEAIGSNNISQFSDINMVDYVVQIVSDSIEEVNYQYVGYMVNKSASKGAQMKYGENHLKMAIQMGLVSEKPYVLTELGKEYLKLSEEKRSELKPKLFLRVPLIQKLLIDSKNQKIDAMDEMRMYLSEKTAIRRRSNIKKLLAEIAKISSTEMQKQIMDNIQWS